MYRCSMIDVDAKGEALKVLSFEQLTARIVNLLFGLKSNNTATR